MTHHAFARFPAVSLAVALACGGGGSTTADSGTGSSSSTSATSSTGTTVEPTTGPDATTSSGTATTDQPTEGSATGDGSGGSTGADVDCDGVQGLIDMYKAAHPGNGGKDWDINAKSDAELAGDPLAQQLLALCGADQRPVVPQMAWEYGGNDHPWIAPEASALYYCVYIPVNPSGEHWQFDADAQKVTADMSIGCPAQNPCNDQTGAEMVLSCLGDISNIEIIVDTMSRNDGVDVGYDLSEAQTDVWLVLTDDTRVFVYNVP